MIDVIAIQDALYSWITMVTGREFTWLDQNDPRLNKPYIGGRVTVINQIGQDYTAGVDNAGAANIYGNREITLYLQHFGAASLLTLENLRSSLEKASVLQSLRTNGLVYANTLSINDVSLKVGSRYEERAQYDSVFRVLSTETDSGAGNIDTVNLNSKYKDAGNNIIQEFNEVITKQ